MSTPWRKLRKICIDTEAAAASASIAPHASAFLFFAAHCRVKIALYKFKILIILALHDSKFGKIIRLSLDRQIVK